ncbi:hypothetical protein SKAU_G00034070 [Synaphobranchus kaupii]|uniref:Uncharacterized protein n=1 Tax=Synaphobranchus kaupii TaxID=118154 RepID=A0A9Q1GFQ9_SYNKA|nr:hypothetical protein SKAU_G00034070 [Synaphobranchus kaupii]
MARNSGQTVPCIPWEPAYPNWGSSYKDGHCGLCGPNFRSDTSTPIGRGSKIVCLRVSPEKKTKSFWRRPKQSTASSLLASAAAIIKFNIELL